MIGRFGQQPEPSAPTPEAQPAPAPPAAPPQSASHGPVTVNQEERTRLRHWVDRCRANYVRLALEIAQLESDKEANAARAEISYNKLKRVREEFEEAKKVLTALD